MGLLLKARSSSHVLTCVLRRIVALVLADLLRPLYMYVAIGVNPADAGSRSHVWPTPSGGDAAPGARRSTVSIWAALKAARPTVDRHSVSESGARLLGLATQQGRQQQQGAHNYLELV